MQPNKSVEELFEEYEGRAVNNWRAEGTTEEFIENRKRMQQIVKEIKAQITNTVLQGVVERVEKEKVKVYDNWATSHDRDEERFTKLTKEEKGYNKGLDLSLSLINDQIISNEEKKETWETKVGMLRQWLNEDRITDPQKMVTNEQIIKWLE